MTDGLFTAIVSQRHTYNHFHKVAAALESQILQCICLALLIIVQINKFKVAFVYICVCVFIYITKQPMFEVANNPS